MARLKSNNFELELKILSCKDFDPTEFHYKIIMKWNGIPIVNNRAMKRSNSYWKQGKDGVIALELDTIHLLHAIEKALETNELQHFETFPDPDIHFAIYPNLSFYPRTVFSKNSVEDSEHFAIIISPNSYQYKNSQIYETFEGISFVITPTIEELKEFTKNLRSEMLEKAQKTFGKPHKRTLVTITKDKQRRFFSKKTIKIPACEIELDSRGFVLKKI